MRTYSSTLLLGCVLAGALIGCTAGELTLPTDGLPHRLDAVEGDGQRGAIGAQLPSPLVVRLVDAAGLPVTQTTVTFHTDVADAELEPATIATNDTGYAWVNVRLGSLEGTQVVEARLAQATAANLSASFSLIAVASKQRDQGGGEGRNGGSDDGDGHDDED